MGGFLVFVFFNAMQNLLVFEFPFLFVCLVLFCLAVPGSM